MSTTAIVPPNQSSLLRQIPQLTARARALFTTMNLHYAGVAVLVILDLYLIIHLVLVGQALKAHNEEALAQQGIALKTAELQAKPLRGLDAKLVDSTAAADKFYAQRLPYASSQMLAELGALTKRQSVRLSRVQYSQNAVLSGADALTEVRMDASVSGDYRPIVQFINSIERDKMFFIIGGINLSGQQTGQVNLRINLRTWLRQPNVGELTADLPIPDDSKSAVEPEPVPVTAPAIPNFTARGGKR
jgi:type IV pilus assembly protein PilO